MPRLVIYVTWIWIIIVGGILIIFRPGQPPEPVCIVCGNNGLILGLISVVLGLAGFVVGSKALASPTGGR